MLHEDRPMTWFTRLCCLLLVAGCAPPPPVLTPAAVRLSESDEAHMVSCRFLGTVTESEFGLASARVLARNSAAALGATHFAWGPFSAGDVTTVTAKGYACPAPPLPGAAEK
jgi:hypothetical protein